MPVGHLVKESSAEAETLRNELITEWNLLGVSAPGVFDDSAPILIEDEQGGGRFGERKPIHLYVIWDKWQFLSQRERSEIIMDAYTATHDAPKIIAVTLAMGLTRAEANKMGLKYTTG